MKDNIEAFNEYIELAKRDYIYLETEQVLPESQEKFGLIEIKEKRWDAKAYEDDIECSCTECGQDFNCRVNHGYHYPWSKWTIKTKGYTLKW